MKIMKKVINGIENHESVPEHKIEEMLNNGYIFVSKTEWNSWCKSNNISKNIVNEQRDISEMLTEVCLTTQVNNQK